MEQPKNISDLARSESGQFAIAWYPEGSTTPTFINQEPRQLRVCINEVRGMAKEERSNGAKCKIDQLPEYFIYNVERENGEKGKIAICPVEFFGITPTPRPEKVVKEKPVKAEVAEGEKPKGKGGRKKKEAVEAPTSGSATIPVDETVTTAAPAA